MWSGRNYRRFGRTYCLYLGPEDGGSMFLRNVCRLLWDNSAPYLIFELSLDLVARVLHKNVSVQDNIGTIYTRSDRQRDADFRNRLRANNLIENITLHQNSWLDHLERRSRSRLPKLAFQYQPQGRRDAGWPSRRWKDQEQCEFKAVVCKI
jgi:hypothetical protein